jgi:hypothetical protein
VCGLVVTDGKAVDDRFAAEAVYFDEVFHGGLRVRIAEGIGTGRVPCCGERLGIFGICMRFYEYLSTCVTATQGDGVLAVSPIRSSSPKPMSLNPTAIIPACIANATASVAFLSWGPSPFGSDVAMNSAMEPAQSGLPVVLSCTMVAFCRACSCL